MLVAVYNWFVIKTGFWEIRKMSGDIEKGKRKVELDDLGRLIDKYAQSRSLGLLLPLAIIVINSVVIVGSIELVNWKPTW